MLDLGKVILSSFPYAYLRKAYWRLKQKMTPGDKLEVYSVVCSGWVEDRQRSILLGVIGWSKNTEPPGNLLDTKIY